MTDKEQIMCKYKFQDKEKFDGKPYCICFNELCEDLFFVCDHNCQIYEDDKQLARKTQECEELKEKVKAYEKLALHIKCPHCNNELGLILNGSEDNHNLFVRYRKALEDIEEFIEEEDWSILDYVFARIKDIISKAKGEGE